MSLRCADDKSIAILRVAVWFERIVIPVILCLGWPGNFMLYRIMQSSLYKSTHVSVFFKFLVLVDSTLLFVDLGRWLDALGLINIHKVTDCGWLFFVGLAPQMMSNYTLLLHNFDRAMFVMVPNISLKYFNRKHIKIYCVAIACIIAVISSHLIYTLHFNEDSSYTISGTPCKFYGSERWSMVGWPIFYNVFGIAIPFVGILVCATFLIRFVKESRKKVGKKLTCGQRKSLRNTIVLSLFYLLCSSPFALLHFLIRFINFSKSCHVHTIWVLINCIFIQLTFFGYSVKFYLLASQSSVIRKHLLKILINGNIDKEIRQAQVCKSAITTI
ncbi:hypothetical protein GJ496_007214 [Pomphorhynchus laevis]|nr:hypothetical protein GJ496_008438 [Pomphorhynchus laevis]KAI0981971.1 hypothetical protein GJ496_007214 [Pomphorhynchus laevis]